MSATAFRFDQYTLDLSRASLRRDGEAVELRPKTFDVLHYLVENAGRVVSKDEIFAAAWPNVTVTDDSLVQCIRELRQALQDDPPRLIKTIPRRGYMLDAPVTPITATNDTAPPATPGTPPLPIPAAPKPPRPTRMWAIGAAVALLVAGVMATAWMIGFHRQPPPQSAGPPSVAVLFSASGDVGGNDRTYDYFSDGLSDEVVTALGRFSGLRVLASSSLHVYRRTPWEPQQLWRDLGVRYILDGGVRRSGDRLRVNARLTDAAQRMLLWSDSYDEEIKDVFALQDRLARSIVGRLAVRISRIEQERVAAKPTSNMEAYDYVLRGRERLARITRADNLEARRLFRIATELDSRYAAAFVGLGHSHLNDALYGWSERPSESLRLGYEFGHRAANIDNNDPGGHLLLANVYVVNREYALALAEADRGLELNPNDADGHATRAAVLVWSGRIKEAIAAFDAAAQFDPSHSRPRSLAHLGVAYFLEGQYGEAVRVFELSIGRNPEFGLAYVGLAAAYGELGKSAEAARAAKMVRRNDPFFASASFGTQFAQEQHRMRMVESLKRAGL